MVFLSGLRQTTPEEDIALSVLVNGFPPPNAGASATASTQGRYTPALTSPPASLVQRTIAVERTIQNPLPTGLSQFSSQPPQNLAEAAPTGTSMRRVITLGQPGQGSLLRVLGRNLFQPPLAAAAAALPGTAMSSPRPQIRAGANPPVHPRLDYQAGYAVPMPVYPEGDSQGTEGAPAAKRRCEAAAAPSAPVPYVVFREGATRCAFTKPPKADKRHYSSLSQDLWTVDTDRGTATCKECNVTFLNIPNITDPHQEKHRKQNPNKTFLFTCGYYKRTHCMETFSSLSERARHWSMAHEFQKGNDQYCPVCDLFTGETHLQEHVATQHLLAIFRCAIPGCGSENTSLQTLSAHIRNRHISDDTSKSLPVLRAALFDPKTGLPKTPLPKKS